MKKFIILIPLYNDWKSVSKLLQEVDLQISEWNAEVTVIIVNDASTEERTNLVSNFKKIKFIKILNMKENRVHQRCIAAGLKYAYKNEDFNRIFIMDADGEDRPEELNDFLKKAEENPNFTVVGHRFQRSEGIFFKIMYQIHKTLTFIFTGKLIKFGNFSCLPKDHVGQLIKTPYLWNSYSSSVMKTINNRLAISSIRGARYFGPSKMYFFGLVFHSLGIISVFKNIVIVRSIVFFLVYFLLIYENISTVTIIPVLFLLVFVLAVLKISTRSNMKEFNSSLDNIGSVDILRSSDSRQ